MESTPVVPQLSRSSLSDETKLSLPRPLKKFYLGEPLALGITQIFIGIIGIAFGVVLDSAHLYTVEYTSMKTQYWTGILYIISGSLSVAAARNPKMSLVKGMLGMNVVSAVAAGVGIIFLSLSVSFFYPRWYFSFGCEHAESTAAETQCIVAEIPYEIVYGILILFMAFTILEFCIAISSAAFGCKTVCRDAYAETVVVVYQNMTPIDTASQTAAPKDLEVL